MGCSRQTDIGNNQHLDALKSAPLLFVYEGLPHPLREASLLQSELKRTDITKIGEFPFYTPKATATSKQAARLKQILCRQANYYISGVPTDCSPFHPDYAVAWMVSETEHQLLVCFSCDEARFLSADNTSSYDLRSTTELKVMLSEFKAERPTE